MGWSILDADFTPNLVRIARRFTGVFYPKANRLDSADSNKPNAEYSAVDATGKFLGTLTIKGNEWGAYNSREPGAARDGRMLIQRDGGSESAGAAVSNESGTPK